MPGPNDALMERAEKLAVMAVENPTEHLEEYQKVTALCREIDWPNNPLTRRNGVKPQTRKILDYMKRKGYITLRDAIMDLDVSSLTKRICEIQDEGYTVLKEPREHVVTGKRYTRYSLAEDHS